MLVFGVTALTEHRDQCGSSKVRASASGRSVAADLYRQGVGTSTSTRSTARPGDAHFTEHLRLLAVVRALEASLAGIPRELHLEAT